MGSNLRFTSSQNISEANCRTLCATSGIRDVSSDLQYSPQAGLRPGNQAESGRQSNGDNLTGLEALKRLQDCIHKGPQIFNLIRARMQNDHSDRSAAELYLMGYALVDGQQYFVASGFCGLQQLTVLLALEASLLRRVRIMPAKIVPEVERQALVK